MKSIRRFAFLVSVAALFASGCGESARNGTFTVTICATTDVHGKYFDSLYNDKDANPTSLANVSSYLKELRGEGVDPILIDVGDMLQGDNAAYYFNYVADDTSHVFARMARYLGYDALVVGNHDVETGHDVYDRISSESFLPYLAANAENDRDGDGVADLREEDGGDAVCDPYFMPYCTVRRNGLKVAVIGMTNANIKSWLPSSKWEGVDFTVISEFAQKEVDKVISDEKPDVLILAVHTGRGSGEGPDRENEALYLASTLKGVDAVFYGHDHHAFAQKVENPSGDVLIINEGYRAQNVGRVDITVEKSKGRVVSKDVDFRLVPMSDYPVDEEFMAYFDNDFREVKAFALKPIGEMAEDIDISDALKGPSTYVDLLQKVQMKYSGADISFAAPLSRDGVIYGGPVTFQDLFKIYIFENQLFVVKMTGAQIKDYLEYAYQIWLSDGVHFNRDCAAGIIYEVSRSASMGSRVRIISMQDGKPFSLDSTYKVALTSYRASGGGKLLTEGAHIDADSLEIIDRLPDIRSLIGEYIGEVGKVEPRVSDNWKFVE